MPSQLPPAEARQGCERAAPKDQSWQAAPAYNVQQQCTHHLLGPNSRMSELFHSPHAVCPFTWQAVSLITVYLLHGSNAQPPAEACLQGWMRMMPSCGNLCLPLCARLAAMHSPPAQARQQDRRALWWAPAAQSHRESLRRRQSAPAQAVLYPGAR